MCLNYTHSLLRVKFGVRGEDGGLAAICYPSFALGYSSSHKERRRVSAVKRWIWRRWFCNCKVACFCPPRQRTFVLNENAPSSSMTTHLRSQ